MISKGEEWGSAATGPAQLIVTGGDADLAAAVAGQPGSLISLVPDESCDLARAVGLVPGVTPAGEREVPLDLLSRGVDGSAVNAMVLGVAPDRLRWSHRRRELSVEVDGRAETLTASGIVILTGQYLRGADLSPRSHPGDGVLEVQAYGLAPGQRRAMRARLATGSHLPHPQIRTWRGRRVVVRAGRPWDLEIDGRAVGTAISIEVELRPGAYRLLL